MTEITDIRELRRIIRSPACREVLAQIRFGVSETWIKLAKSEALALTKSVAPGTTPAHFEMHTDSFGDWQADTGLLYLG